MLVEDQQPVVDFLESWFSAAGDAVERIETHSAIVFLAGGRAWKLKRAVLFDYLDFSTAERRQAMCEAEVRLNRRTAPALYHRVIPVTREQRGKLALDGPGEPIDWVIEMSRFDQDRLFDRLAAAGKLDLDTMDALAHSIASFHASAVRRDDHGGAESMRWVVEGNAAGFTEFGASFLDRVARKRLIAETLDAITRTADLLERRRYDGFVRQCHGDLHLRNIVMLDGQPTLFDAIEFNDQLSCIDVWYDLAFLLMDLAARRLRGEANVVFNRYLDDSQDIEALPLLPLFLSCRAAIRAKTSATAATMQRETQARDALQARASQYLALGESLLRPVRPTLIAIGGPSGTGKSTLARALAPDIDEVPGAVVLRSDEIRKDLFGVPRLMRLGTAAYGTEASVRVYRTMQERAAHILAAGRSVVADAVFARPEFRAATEGVAAAASALFVGLWLDAPENVLVDRTIKRQHDASDADATIVRKQLAESPGPINWQRIDASGPPSAVFQRAREALGPP